MIKTIFYLHGFASGPQSTKGVAFDKHFSERGYRVERLNLRVPSFEHLRLSEMIKTVRHAIDASGKDRVFLIGSSLGGLTAARVAERDPRVVATVLLAPAFELAARWRDTLGTELERWRETGWREVNDYTTGGTSRIDFGFLEDVQQVDVGMPDVRVPTLILHGRGDDVVPLDHARRFADGRNNVRLIELDDGHELVASLPTLLDESERFLRGMLEG